MEASGSRDPEMNTRLFFSSVQNLDDTNGLVTRQGADADVWFNDETKFTAVEINRSSVSQFTAYSVAGCCNSASRRAEDAH